MNHLTDLDHAPPEQIAAWSVEGFCRAHGIGRTTFYEELKAGRLVARKARGRTIVTVEDARAWREALPKLESAGA